MNQTYTVKLKHLDDTVLNICTAPCFTDAFYAAQSYRDRHWPTYEIVAIIRVDTKETELHFKDTHAIG